MIARIARKETMEMLRDGRYRWTATILLILLLGALLAGWKHYADIEAQRTLSQNSDRDMWLEQEEKNQHSAAHYGVYAFKPMLALAALDQGVLSYTGVSVFMEAHSVKDAIYRPVEDATAVQRLGSLTASMTLQLLIPLLIILLAFSTFSGEREQGTLRQVLSLGVSRSTLGIGKALGVIGPLFIMIIPATLLGVLAIAVLDGGGETIWEGSRLILMVVSYLLYFGIFILISLLVSAFAVSSRQALVILMGFWMFTNFIGPRMVTDWAEEKYPVPAPSVFDAAIRADIEGLIPWPDRMEAVQNRLMEKHKVSTVEEIPTSVAGHTLFEAERDETSVYRKHYGDLAKIYASQEQLTQYGAFIAPVVAIQFASMGFAGSDYRHHRHFVEAAEEYRFEYVQTLNQNLIDSGASWDYKAGRELWESIPPFSYTLPRVQEVLGHYAPSLAVLGIWNVMLLLLATFAITKMKIG